MDNNIDVVQIMADITNDVNKRYREIEMEEKAALHILQNVSEDLNGLNGEFCQGIKTRNHFLAGEVGKIHSLSGIPWKIPSFESKKALLRLPLKFVARVILKLSRFITIQQNEFNETVTKSLELLQESTLSMADWSRNIEERLKDLTDTVNGIVDVLNYMDPREIDCINLTDKMYRDFEEKYRGSTEEIRKKQNYYIYNYGYILEKISMDDAGIIVDLGCGRGEWLTLLKEKGYDGIGVDLNKEFLGYCENNGIKTAHMDVINYLKTLPPESVKLLSSFQLIEHLSTNKLLDLMKEIGRVMRKGGFVILETPNPVNVNVGTASFYLDPTHKRQIHPELLKFLAEENGLTDIQIAYWQQDDIEKWWAGIWKNDRTNVKDSNMYRAMEATFMQSFWCSADYALIGRKS